MKKITFIIAIFMIFTTSIFAQPEEAYVELRANGMKNEFYKILLDEENGDIYLGIESLIDFFGLENLNFNKNRYTVKGNLDNSITVDYKISKNNVINIDDDSYIPLDEIKKIFHITKSHFDEERFTLELNLKFKTKLDYALELNKTKRVLALSKREKEMEEEEIYIQEKAKLISPGILKLSYSKADMEESDYSFGIDYGTQLLYGEFTLGQKIVPESNLDYIRLKYRDVIKNDFLTLGDFYLENTTLFDTEKSLRGLSLSKNENYGFTRFNSTIIEGEAFNANVVELYRNGLLEDFELLSGRNNFYFNVPTVSSMDRYSIKISYNDGRTEYKEISIIGSNNVLLKGDSDYLLQVGEGVDYKKKQYLAKYKYGVTKNLTLGSGISYLENKDGEKYQVYEGSFATRRNSKDYPTLFSGNIKKGIANSDINFETSIEQQLGRNTSINAKYEKYGPYISEAIKADEIYSISFNKVISRLSGSVGYIRQTYDSLKFEKYYVNFDYSLNRNTKIGLLNSYNRGFGDDDKIENFGTEARVYYSGFKEFLLQFEAKRDYDQWEIYDDEIKLIATRNTSNESFLPNMDVNFEVGYSKSKGKFFEIGVSYYFDGFFYAEFPRIIKNNEKTTIGGGVQKSIYLGNPLLNMNNDNISDGWVEGKVYIDKNNNGSLDENETILDGVEVITSGGTAITDKNGQYLIGNISGHDIHSIEINSGTIDPTLVMKNELQKFKGSPSSRVTVNIPLVPVSILSGNVYSSDNVDGKMYSNLVGNIEALLINENGEEVSMTTLDRDGYYFFEDIVPGEYTVELKSKSIRYTPQFDKTSLKIDVKNGTEGDYYEENDFTILSIESTKKEETSEE